jgi:nicotinate-nucleotide adenylyltransferase
MKIGLFFGSFNPIHTGHLIIANHIANFHIDKVWFVVSPQNPFKKSKDLLDAGKRLELVKLAIQHDDRFQVSDIEFRLPLPSYTINTVTELSKMYNDVDFQIIIGSDTLQNLFEWKSAAQLTGTFNFLVYERPGFPINKDSLQSNFTVVTSALLNISATTIRDLISQQKSIRYLVPEPVRLKMEEENYYK